MKPAKSLPFAALCALAAPALPAQQTRDSGEIVLVDAFPAQKKLELPLYVDHHPTDPDVTYVVEQGGVIWRVPRDAKQTERTQFLDWSKRVLRANWEEGLLGLAFDPDYERNGYLYVYWSQEVPGGEGATPAPAERKGAQRERPIRRQSVISRLHEVDGFAGPLADPESELVLLTIPQPFGNHNGGTIVFGPDGMLYVALGDGGKANDPFGNAQNRKTLLGSVLRIDVRGATPGRPYRIPEDNPFVPEADDGVRGEIWCYGMRNPWRISFDRETGDLWCGDVGQNLFEEVDRLVKGGNYGWNHREARHPFALGHRSPKPKVELLEPIAEYPHSQGQSITGGSVYRGRLLPSLVGRYVYGDFVTLRIWAVAEGEEPREICRAGAPIASFGETPEGELLVVCFDGRVYRMEPRGR